MVADSNNAPNVQLPGSYTKAGELITFPQTFSRKDFPKLDEDGLILLNLTQTEGFQGLTNRQICQSCGFSCTKLNSLLVDPDYIEALESLWGPGGRLVRAGMPEATRQVLKKAQKGHVRAWERLSEYNGTLKPKNSAIIDRSVTVQQANISIQQTFHVAIEAARQSKECPEIEADVVEIEE